MHILYFVGEPKQCQVGGDDAVQSHDNHKATACFELLAIVIFSAFCRKSIYCMRAFILQNLDQNIALHNQCTDARITKNKRSPSFRSKTNGKFLIFMQIAKFYVTLELSSV